METSLSEVLYTNWFIFPTVPVLPSSFGKESYTQLTVKC